MIHVFVAHTPLHMLFVERLIADLELEHDSVKVFYEGSVPQGFPFPVTVLPGYTGYRAGRQIAQENSSLILKDISSHSGPVTLYCSDLKWTTNNAIYAGLQKVHRKNTILFPDGLGSYLPRQDWWRLGVASAVKTGLGLVRMGPRYQALRGDHFGMDGRYVQGVYGPHAERLNGNATKLELPMKNSDSGQPSDPKGGLLFLGVPLDEHRFSRSQAEEIVSRAAKQAVALNVFPSAPVYKSHHFEEKWIADYFEANGFRISADKRAAELVVADQGITRLVGYYSSALALAPAVAPHDCQAFSVGFEDVAAGYMNRADRDRLKKIMNDFGVEFIDE